MYYLSLDGKQAGPFDFDYVRSGWKGGTLPPETLFWQEGMAEWQPLESIRSRLEQPAAGASAAAPMLIGGFWRRVGAFLLDVLLLGIVGFGSGYFFFDYYMSLGLAGILIGLAVATAYFGVLNSALGSGQTLGKRVLGLRVVDRAGNLIPPVTSVARYLILALPFFLNRAVTDGLVTSLGTGALIMLPVMAAFAALTYLLIFNRRTRQLVHDLAVGTYVVRVGSPQPALAPRLWRGHLAILAALCVLIVAVGCLSPLLARAAFFQPMFRVRQAILATGEVQAATVTGGTAYVATASQMGSTRVLSILAHVRTPKEATEATAAQFAQLALQADPTIAGYDDINISLSFGYDIGIASGTVTNLYSHSPEDWKRAAGSAGTGR